MPPYVILEKAVGETPLQCVERWRAAQTDAYQSVPLAYAGRLDPMASGKLLVLIGDECKRQQEYHALDKEYEFEILFGTKSDTGDVLGIVSDELLPSSRDVNLGLAALSASSGDGISSSLVEQAVATFTGTITLPYPAYSSKTVGGKPLHTWTLEGRLQEIEIPRYAATIYALDVLDFKRMSAEEIYTTALRKINSLPPVTEASKAIGNDFRRTDVRESWEQWLHGHRGHSFPIATLRCHGSSGLYMRTLAEAIAEQLGTTGLAFSIHRTKIFLE